jgi:uncharacterized protein YigE (DUF2233 family)
MREGGVGVLLGCNHAVREGRGTEAKNRKASRRGSILANDAWGGSYLHREGVFWMRKGGVGVLLGCNHVVREGRGTEAKNRKASRWGSVSANDSRGGSYLRREGVFWMREGGFGVL